MLLASKQAVDLHIALSPYKRNLTTQMLADGSPPVRHTLHCCPVADTTSNLFDSLTSQLMLGDDLVVVPVVVRGGISVTATVPPACSCAGPSAVWHSMWDETTLYMPGQVCHIIKRLLTTYFSLLTTYYLLLTTYYLLLATCHLLLST